MANRKEHRGLSPSSLSLYQSCARKYFYKKVAKVSPDADYVEDSTVFNIGKAFHRACEDSNHRPSSLNIDQISGICELYDLDVQEYFPVVFAMLSEYEKVHVKSGLEAVACEVEIETDVFFGICDVVLKSSTGDWWIGDLKTAASFTPAQVNSLLYHPQLNLYAAHAPIIAKICNLELTQFKGCRYRVTTKSKLQRKPLEPMSEYIARLRQSIKSVDYILPFTRMNSRATYLEHKRVVKELASTNLEDYRPNFGNCFAYWKPCEFWSKCNGRLCSESGNLEAISN